MKRKTISKKLSILLVCLMAMLLVGCSNNKTDDNNAAEPNATANSTENDTSTGEVVAGSETGTNAGDTANDDANNNATTNDANGGNTTQIGIPQAAEANPINDNIRGYYSETIAYPLLENEIIDELDLENMDMTKTRYYYNFVDLDDDGVDEIIVQLNGEYNTTKDGDTLLIVKQTATKDKDDDDDGFDVIAKYTAFANPVIVSDKKTNGHRDLIFMDPKSNPTSYKKVTFGKKEYGKMSSAETIKSIDDVTGVALLCNDISSDTENKEGLFFS